MHKSLIFIRLRKYWSGEAMRYPILEVQPTVRQRSVVGWSENVRLRKRMKTLCVRLCIWESQSEASTSAYRSHSGWCVSSPVSARYTSCLLDRWLPTILPANNSPSHHPDTDALVTKHCYASPFKTAFVFFKVRHQWVFFGDEYAALVEKLHLWNSGVG